MNLSDILGKEIPDCDTSKSASDDDMGFVSVPGWVLKGGSGVLAACIAGKLSCERASKVLCVEAEELEEVISMMTKLGLAYYDRCMNLETNFEEDFSANVKDTMVTGPQLEEAEGGVWEFFDEL